MNDTMIRQMALNLAAAMQCFAQGSAEGQTHEDGGILLVDVGPSSSAFNSALLTQPVETTEEFERRAAAAARYFERNGSPWSFWICEGMLPSSLLRSLDTLLDRHELKLSAQSPGMAAAELAEPQRAAPPLMLRPVGDEATRRAFCHILTVTFAGPPEVMARVYGAAGLWNTRFRGWIGSLDGYDVVAGATVADAGVIGVYAVGTLPSHTRQGCAEALVRHAVAAEQAIYGRLPVVLQATGVSLKLYRRLGFSQHTSFRLYSRR